MQVGTVLMQSYGGRAARLVRQARRSAIRLVDLIAASFPGFRDQTVYRGAQVFLYKRAQIFVADVFGAFQGKGLGRFDDIGELTTFADYRVPVVLEKLGGILHLDPALKKRVRFSDSSCCSVPLCSLRLYFLVTSLLCCQLTLPYYKAFNPM